MMLYLINLLIYEKVKRYISIFDVKLTQGFGPEPVQTNQMDSIVSVGIKRNYASRKISSVHRARSTHPICTG